MELSMTVLPEPWVRAPPEGVVELGVAVRHRLGGRDAVLRIHVDALGVEVGEDGVCRSLAPPKDAR